MVLSKATSTWWSNYYFYIAVSDIVLPVIEFTLKIVRITYWEGISTAEEHAVSCGSYASNSNILEKNRDIVTTTTPISTRTSPMKTNKPVATRTPQNDVPLNRALCRALKLSISQEAELLLTEPSCGVHDLQLPTNVAPCGRNPFTETLRTLGKWAIMTRAGSCCDNTLPSLPSKGEVLGFRL